MFPNLVHLSLMRSLKSRFSMIALIILLVMALYFLIFSLALERGGILGFDSGMAKEIYDVAFANRGMYFQQGRAFSFIDSWIDLLLMMNTIFVVCDYYKFNLRVNLEGAVQEKYKFVLADISALCILSFIFSILNSITLFSGILLGETNVLLLDHPLRALMMCIANALNIFCSVIEAYAIAQLFRSKILSAIVIIVEGLVAGLLDIHITEMMSNASNGTEKIYTGIVHSTFMMSEMASGSETMDTFILRIALISITVKILIASILSLVFYMWRREK